MTSGLSIAIKKLYDYTWNGGAVAKVNQMTTRHGRSSNSEQAPSTVISVHGRERLKEMEPSFAEFANLTRVRIHSED